MYAAVLHTLPEKYRNSLNFCGSVKVLGPLGAFVRYERGKMSVKEELVSNVKVLAKIGKSQKLEGMGQMKTKGLQITITYNRGPTSIP